MITFVCQICGEAYIGKERPHDCPYCGATEHFIKLGNEAHPITNQKEEIGDVSRKNLLETLELERTANALYLCMANKSDKYEIKAMYKALAKVEMEHAVIVTKLLDIARLEIKEELCSDDMVENFKKTIELEETATNLYVRFAKEATEKNVKIFFTALAQVERGHIELIKSYL